MAGPGRPKAIDDSKVFDVAKPNKAKPVGTSRPVIVNHANAVTDTSIKPVAAKQPLNDVVAPSVPRKVIAPLTDAEKTAPPVPEPAAETVEVEAEAAKTAEISEPAQVAIKTEAPAEPAKKKARNSTSEIESNPAIIEITMPDEIDLLGEEEETPSPSPAEPSAMDKLAADPSEAVVADETTTTTDAEVEQVEAAAKPEEKAPASSSRQKVIKPITPATSENASEAAEKAPQPMPKPEPTQQPEAAASEAGGQTPANAGSSDAAAVDALAEASEKTKVDKKTIDEQAKKDAALQQLIDSKKYFVPLAHDSTSSGHKGGLLWGLLLLLALAAGGYYVLDAQIVKNSVALPFEIFK